MPQLLIALGILFGGLWTLRKMAKLGPAAASAFLQKAAGVGVMAFSGLLLLRGQVNVATALFAVGAGLFGKSAAYPNGFGWGRSKTPGQTSTVTTSLLVMVLDHDSGALAGHVVAGPFAGRALSNLNDLELRGFYVGCQTAPDQSLSLLEAWIARERPEWRGGDSHSAASKPSSATMSRNDAFSVLGLKPGASDVEIKAAHKNLMKQYHPDKGGTDYLAAKINEAKDVLLGS
ncbi:MAG: DnaJ domain-containing protein [Alphaproteobacteria bacterium]|nr:DnaJ domain-containing protein [Alphaproteobacteria bacterium]